MKKFVALVALCFSVASSQALLTRDELTERGSRYIQFIQDFGNISATDSLAIRSMQERVYALCAHSLQKIHNKVVMFYGRDRFVTQLLNAKDAWPLWTVDLEKMLIDVERQTVVLSWCANGINNDGDLITSLIVMKQVHFDNDGLIDLIEEVYNTMPNASIES